MSPPVIHVNGIRKSYGDTIAVDDVSFDVQPGEIFGLIGPNGAGKTTTMECIEGLRVHDRGVITVLGLDPTRDAYALQERIGVQLQAAQLQKRIKVREAVALWASLYRKPVNGDRLIEQLGLADKRDSWFMTLSGGQKQRLFIALALINDPELVFLDELTTGLDPQSRRTIWDLVRGIRQRGKTVFLTTHLMEEAERLCDRVADHRLRPHHRHRDSRRARPAPLSGAHRDRRDRGSRRRRAIPDDSRRAIGERGRPGALDSRRRRRSGDRGHPLRRRTSHAGDRVPDRAADARGRVSQGDRPHHPGLRTDDDARTVATDVARDQNLHPRPLGVIGTVAVPVLIFILFGRLLGGTRPADAPKGQEFGWADLPILVSLLIALSAVLSLVTIIAIYREGGILKRLRATPLRPHTILAAHVLVKLLFTAVTLALMVMAGQRYFRITPGVPLLSFTIALLYCTVCILSLGFLIASIVPTARFAQPIGTLLLYPMLGLSGLFMPGESLPPMLQGLSRVLPLTYAVSLLRGIWRGDGWIPHLAEVAVLAIMFAVCTALSAKVFRWE